MLSENHGKSVRGQVEGFSTVEFVWVLFSLELAAFRLIFHTMPREAANVVSIASSKVSIVCVSDLDGTMFAWWESRHPGLGFSGLLSPGVAEAWNAVSAREAGWNWNCRFPCCFPIFCFGARMLHRPRSLAMRRSDCGWARGQAWFRVTLKGIHWFLISWMFFLLGRLANREKRVAEDEAVGIPDWWLRGLDLKVEHFAFFKRGKGRLECGITILCLYSCPYRPCCAVKRDWPRRRQGILDIICYNINEKCFEIIVRIFDFYAGWRVVSVMRWRLLKIDVFLADNCHKHICKAESRNMRELAARRLATPPNLNVTSNMGFNLFATF